MSDKTSLSTVGTGCGLLLVSMIPSYLLNGYVFSKLWLWFIVPRFGVEPMPVRMAVGVSMLVWFLTTNHSSGTKFKFEDGKIREPTFAEAVAAGLTSLFVYPLLVLLLGWFWHSYMVE